MLLSRGFQPPRKYSIPVHKEQAQAQANECTACTKKAWTPILYSKLHEAIGNDSTGVTNTFRLNSHELRQMVIQGCQFCQSLANGLHGKVFLDELYARFETQNTTTFEDAETGSEGDAVESQSVQSEEEWNDASAFNEDEIDDDVTGGWDAWQDRDTLAEYRVFDVETSFEKGDSGLFTFLNVHIRAFDDEDRIERDPGQNEVNSLVSLRYHMNDRAVATSNPKLFTTTSAGLTLGAEQNLQMITDWTATLKHNMSFDQGKRDNMPARLVDLTEIDLLKIVDTQSLSASTRFAALSYVWGTNQTFILTSKTKSDLQNGFHMQQLPQTIQDAIIVAIRASLRYIWIDALCILQDSAADKAIELPKMQHIYRNAFITIIASIALTASAGFLLHTSQPKYFIDPISITIPSVSRDAADVNLILSYPSSYDRSLGPINSRAWTFQELILANRAILFSYRGISFLNRANPPTANGETSGRDPQLPNLPWNSDFFSLAQPRENICSTWLALRGEYSRRSLTVQGDKLLAIAGLAQEISKSYQSSYFAGMWECDLVTDLLWRCMRTDNPVRNRRSELYVAPSWSWASVDAIIDGAEFDAQVDEECDEPTQKTSTLDFEVVACELELVDPNFEFGAVKSGTLVVKGRGHILLWRPFAASDHITENTDGEVVGKGQDGTDVVLGQAYLDASDEALLNGSEVLCLAMAITRRESYCVGLMLLAVDEGRWRRVGLFETEWRELFDDCDIEEFTIV